MKVRKFRTVLAAVAAISLLLVATPAVAHHENEHGHWHHGHRQAINVPIHDNVGIYRGGKHLPNDASWAWYYESGGMTDSYIASIGARAWNDCSIQWWAITICIDNASPTTANAWTHPAWTGTGWHTAACVIRINGNIAGNLSDRTLWLVVKHEFGHCFGLGHRTAEAAPYSVMYEGEIQTERLDWHDHQGLDAEYWWHWD